MEWPTNAPAIMAIAGAAFTLILACAALAAAMAMRRRLRKAEQAIARIETGRTRALSSAEHLLSAMQRLAAGYRRLASGLRSSSTVAPDCVHDIALARQEVERERAVAHLYWPEGVSPHVKEVTAITDGVDADATVLEEKADRIERHGSATAELFRTRYLDRAA
jgi:hypothetical protein